MAGFSIHGESITDGEASGGIAVTLYESGSVEARTLATKEVLHITDIQIACETGADVWLTADGKVEGEYVWHGTMDAKDFVSIHFSKPFVCAPGTGLTFYGAATNINSCLVEGFIREA